MDDEVRSLDGLRLIRCPSCGLAFDALWNADDNGSPCPGCAADRRVAATLADVVDNAWELNADVDAEGLIEFRKLVADAKRACTDVLARIDVKLAELLPKGTSLVGASEVRVSASAPVRSQWDIDTLVRLVSDTRRFDGEGTLMTDAEKYREVWNFGAPRTTVLKESYGIDPDEHCHIERVAKVQVIS